MILIFAYTIFQRPKDNVDTFYGTFQINVEINKFQQKVQINEMRTYVTNSKNKIHKLFTCVRFKNRLKII